MPCGLRKITGRGASYNRRVWNPAIRRDIKAKRFQSAIRKRAKSGKSIFGKW